MPDVTFRVHAKYTFRDIYTKAFDLFTKLANTTGLDIYVYGRAGNVTDTTMALPGAIKVMVWSSITYELYPKEELEDYIFNPDLEIDKAQLSLKDWFKPSRTGLEIADGNIAFAELVKCGNGYLLVILFNINSRNSQSEFNILKKIVEEAAILINQQTILA